jgi:hypothetical protein
VFRRLTSPHPLNNRDLRRVAESGQWPTYNARPANMIEAKKFGIETFRAWREASFVVGDGCNVPTEAMATWPCVSSSVTVGRAANLGAK